MIQNFAPEFGASSVGKNLNVQVGNGDKDLIEIDSTAVTGNSSIQAGGGDGDTVNIATGHFASEGSLDVTFNGNVQVQLGNGNDTLNLGATGSTVKFAKTAVFDGQGGANTLDEYDHSGTVVGSPKFKNFQTQNHF